MRLSQTKLASNFFYFCFNFQDLHRLCSDADDENYRSSSYYVTNKACFNIQEPLHLSFLPPPSLTATIRSPSSVRSEWMASLVHWR